MKRPFEKHESLVAHTMCRFVDRRYLTQSPEGKAMEKLRELMDQLASFGCLEVLSYAFMGNHLHLLIRVPDREEFMKNFTEEDLWKHLEILYSEEKIELWRKECTQLRDRGANEAAERMLEKFRDRMFNLSAFWQQLKRRFTRWYNFVHKRTGTLWEGVYRCVLVEDSPEALSVVAAYIDLNPVRAGIVKDPADYPCSSYGAAVGGSRSAQLGLMKTHHQEEGTWEEFMVHYRMLLYGQGVEQRTEEGMLKRSGFDEETVHQVRQEGGRLSLWQMLRSRNRYFTHGGAIGSAEFLKGLFETNRSYFGQRRKAASYAMKGGAKVWGRLRSQRDLRSVE